MKIIFHNAFHNGDLHISREFIRKIMSKVQEIDPNATFSYAHNNDPCLLADIPNLTYLKLDGLNIDQFENLTRRGDAILINTWYAQQRHRYMNVHGMTLDCLYQAFDDTCKSLWNFSLSQIGEPSSFIPTIDYSAFEIEEAQPWLAKHPQKKIFISNGHALSGQATNFLMAPLIGEIAQNHPDEIFILSNDEGQFNLPSNVFFSKDIIKKKSGSDLNENSFLTTFCNLIIGRASGAFSYAWTQENLLERNCKFLAFCIPGVMFHRGNKFWTSSLLSSKIEYRAQFEECHETDPAKVKSVIERNISSMI